MADAPSTVTDLDETLVEEFADRFFTAVLGAQEIQAAYFGDILGWYQALDTDRALTATELAEATDTHWRYAQEWLEHQAVAGWVSVDDPSAAALERRYTLPAAHAAVLTDPDSLAHLAPLARFVTGVGKRADELAHAYRTGGGVSWQAMGADPREAQAAINRPMFLQLFGPRYLPSIPEIDSLLRAGGRVADIGCGLGWSSIAVAQQYPNATVDGFDPDIASIEAATRIADQAGLADRICFHPTDAAHVEPGDGYDLVMALECIHDLSRPVEVLAAMRELVSDIGVVMVMDERVDDEFSAPGGPFERMLYGCSLTSCLPDGMSDAPSAATGTVMRPSTLERYALDAGFTSVEVLPIDNDSFRFYRLHTT
jgi:2-polyprenyl-3-methyl-5-hydroxy-6-metoxy-1,4-benzoquinol methylase